MNSFPLFYSTNFPLHIQSHRTKVSRVPINTVKSINISTGICPSFLPSILSVSFSITLPFSLLFLPSLHLPYLFSRLCIQHLTFISILPSFTLVPSPSTTYFSFSKSTSCLSPSSLVSSLLRHPPNNAGDRSIFPPSRLQTPPKLCIAPQRART